MNALIKPKPGVCRPVDLEEVRRDLDERGFSVQRDLVPMATFQPIQAFWIEFYRGLQQGKRPPVSWSPALGSRNFVGYSENAFGKLYRTYDFLWNQPYDSLSRALSLELNAVRNRILDQPDSFGTTFSADGQAIYNTTSCYPDDHGWMEVHDDGVAPGARLIHFIMPLTFRDRHYSGGGMVVFDRQGIRQELDVGMRPGDVIFYDGALKHGVDRVAPIDNSDSIGRIQLFAIPTVFQPFYDHPEFYRHLKLSTFVGAKFEVAKAAARQAIRGRWTFRS
jgi:hypothetical protein